MKKIFPVLFFIVLPVRGALNVPLTVQELLYPGDPTGTTYTAAGGITRTNEPFCMGVPIADSAGINDPQTLTLSGASAAQFRTLGTWPSGNVKWVKVCGILPTLTAGGTATANLQSGGSGNSPNTSLASVSGSTITINTTGGACGQAGATCFTVRAGGNFNVIDTATIGTTTVVSSSTASTRGLVLLGPNPTAAYPANVTCGTGAGQSACTTVYSSANDPNSSCTIEENGPVMAALRCIGTHFDNAGHPYMQYTSRLYFFRGKSYVKVTSVIRNANYSGAIDSQGNTFNTAFKGFQSYELRITPNITGSLNYKIAVDSGSCSAGVCTGTLSAATDNAYIYQGLSQLMLQQTDCSVACANTYTTDVGYVAKQNSTSIATNTDGTKSPAAFYADISDSNGVGVMIGVSQGASHWPKSLEFQGGGSDVRVGIWPSENSQPVYQAWPQSSLSDDVLLEFHASSPASLSSDFLRLQHFLVMRADRTYYNSTNVFPYAMPDPTHEDAFYQATWNAATLADGSHPLAGASCCTLDLGTQNTSIWPIQTYRMRVWHDGGPSNQEEFRWSNLLRFLRTGQTGRLLDTLNFYRMQAANSWPHADGISSTDSTPNHFHWRDQTGAIDALGRPLISCSGTGPGDACSHIANVGLSFVDWFETLHFHWYGMLDYYFITGDENIRDTIVPLKDWYMNSNTYQGGATINGQPGLGIVRAIGIELISASRFAEFLAATGDPDASAVLAQGVTNYNLFVKPDICMNNFPAGCTMPPAEPVSYPPDPAGISRVRGAPGSTVGRGNGRCGLYNSTHEYRGIGHWYGSLLIEGLLALRKAQGPSWPDYNLALDLAYGVSQYALAEMFSDDGGAYFYVGGGQNGTSPQDTRYNGWQYSSTYDVPYACPAGTPVVAGTTAEFNNVVYDDLQVVSSARAAEGMFMYYYVQSLMNGGLTSTQLKNFKIALDWVRYAAYGQASPDLGGYQVGSVVETIDEPSSTQLQDVPFTISDLGGGNYAVTATIPGGSSGIRLKWSPSIIANSGGYSTTTPTAGDGLLGYDAFVTGTFRLNPAQYATWFGANDATPAAFSIGANTFNISTGTTGLAAANFSLKAYLQLQTSGAATHLSVAGYPSPTAAGVNHSVIVSALDATNLVATSYTGTVRITSSDPAAVLPAAYTFKQADGGTHTFNVTLNTVGSALSITAADTVSTSITGSETGIQITAVPNPATHLAVTGYPSPTTAGVSHTLTVQALDANNNVATTYLGTVHFTSSDGTAVLPSNYTFQAGDAGARVFNVTFNTAGTQSVSATDTAVPSIAGSQSGIQVNSSTGQATTLSYVSGNNQGAPVGGGSSVAWTHQSVNSTYPGLTGYSNITLDPVSGTVIVPAVPFGSGSIYTSLWQSYNPTTNQFTLINGDGTDVKYIGCSPDKPNQPGNRHPYWQMTVDAIRNWFWLSSGANQGCNGYSVNTSGTTVTNVGTNGYFYAAYAGETVKINGSLYTVASVTDSSHLVLTSPAPSQTGVLFQLVSRSSGSDLYHMTLNSSLATDVWTQETPSSFPQSNVGAMMAFDNVNDVLFYYGGSADHHSVLCYSTGALSAAQQAAGCTSANTFTNISPQNGIASVNGTAVTRVSGDSFAAALTVGDYIKIFNTFCQVVAIPDSDHLTLDTNLGVRANLSWFVQPGAVTATALVFDPQTQNILLYGGSNQSTSVVYNEIWAYSTVNRKWIHKGLSGPPPTESGANGYAQPAFACLPTGGVCYYHQTTGLNAPQDFSYNTGTDTWSLIASSGGGETNMYGSQMAYVPSCNCLVTYANSGGGSGSAPNMWVGSLAGGGSITLPSPLVVKVTDANGNPVAGVTVTFTVTGGNGTLTGGVTTYVVMTDSQGLASAMLTLAVPAGATTVTAKSGTLAGSPVTFTATLGSAGRCDLNGDGVVNVSDARIAAAQAVGTSPCGSADLIGNGKCNVYDVERIVNASQGGVCRTGQ